MILSFHPCFNADKNIICAGRESDDNDLHAIKNADAVILPQGCTEPLYNIARRNCKNVFPNYDVRFGYKDKLGQIELFRKTNVNHPATVTFENYNAYFNHCNENGGSAKKVINSLPPVLEKFRFPLVFKFGWGGEGANVFYVKSHSKLVNILQKAFEYERTGQYGFLLQEFIPCMGRSLRVVIIYQKIISYWRVGEKRDGFYTSFANGAVPDHVSDPALQKRAKAAAYDFCKKTGINLAGFDFLFSNNPTETDPYFLEINYYFGRQGLGGSERYYKILNSEILKWIHNINK